MWTPATAYCGSGSRSSIGPAGYRSPRMLVASCADTSGCVAGNPMAEDPQHPCYAMPVRATDTADGTHTPERAWLQGSVSCLNEQLSKMLKDAVRVFKISDTASP